MISSTINSSFRLFLASDFLYQEVEDEFKLFLKNHNLQFKRVIDYLNFTIVDGSIPGLTDPESSEQKYGKGRTRKFSSSLIPEEQLFDKTIEINFQLKNNYFNWLVLYKQMILYVDRQKRTNEREKTLLPPVYLHIIDEQGNIIIEMEYKGIRLSKISDLKFEKQSNGILQKTFSITLGFNESSFKTNLNNTVNYTSQEFKY